MSHTPSLWWAFYKRRSRFLAGAVIAFWFWFWFYCFTALLAVKKTKLEIRVKYFAFAALNLVYVFNLYLSSHTE